MNGWRMQVLMSGTVSMMLVVSATRYARNTLYGEG